MLLFNRYRYDPDADFLGKGGFSSVYKAYDTRTERYIAIKFFSAGGKNSKYDLSKEINRVIGLDHPNICRYYDTDQLIETRASGQNEVTQVAILELLDRGDIADYLRSNPTESSRRKLLLDVLHGLDYLHKNNIIHRDIKSQNILVKETLNGPVAKIIDFGISKTIDAMGGASSIVLGSIEYMAPEQFNPAKYGLNGSIATNVDLWSFGIMTYELLSGNALFGSRTTGNTTEQLMNNILTEEIGSKVDEFVEPYRTILKKCLVKEAGKRVKKAGELISLLEKQKEETHIRSPEANVVHHGKTPNTDPSSTETLLVSDIRGKEEDRSFSPKEKSVKQESSPLIQEIPVTFVHRAGPERPQSSPIYSARKGNNKNQTWLIWGLVILGIWGVILLPKEHMLIGGFFLFVLTQVISLWKIFAKAGRPGWWAVIPIYNLVVLLDISNKSRWLAISLIIPYLTIIFMIPVNIAVGKVFGKGRWFTLGLAILPFIFYPILAFDDAEYTTNEL